MKEKESDDMLIDKIKDSMDFLDKAIPDRTPDLSQFRKLVAQVEEKKQESKRKEFILFMISAAFLLTIETFTFSHSLVLFAAVQMVALISLPVSLFSWKRHQNRQVKP